MYILLCSPIFQYNPAFDTAVSMDSSGMLEYWGGQRQDYAFPKCAEFDSKLDTDLYEFAKVNQQCAYLVFSRKTIFMLATLFKINPLQRMSVEHFVLTSV